LVPQAEKCVAFGFGDRIVAGVAGKLKPGAISGSKTTDHVWLS
jgi:hypothetical protein